MPCQQHLPEIFVDEQHFRFGIVNDIEILSRQFLKNFRVAMIVISSRCKVAF